MLPLRVLTHQKKRRVLCMLFFEVLLFTTLAVSVNSKTSKKSMQKTATFLVCQGLDTPNAAATFLSCFSLKFYRLPMTRCENGTIRHAFHSSLTVYRHEKTRRLLVFQDLKGLDTPKKTSRFFFACFSFKFYRIRRSGVSRPLGS